MRALRLNPILCKKIAVYSILILITVILFVFAINAYPVLGTDAIFFVPTAINHKMGDGLINQLNDLFLLGNSPGESKDLVFGPLWPLVLSWLMPTASSEGAYLAIFIITGLTLLIAALVYIKFIVSDWQNATWYQIILCALCFFSLAAIIILAPGRPETLSRLLIAIMLLGLFFPYFRWIWLFLGITQGLHIAANPGPALIIFPFIGVFFAFYHSKKKAFLYTFSAYGIAFFIAILIIQFFGNGLLPTLNGLYHHFFANNQTSLTIDEYKQTPIIGLNPITFDTFSGFISILTTSTQSAPLQGFVVTAAIICAYAFWRRIKHKIATPDLFYFFIIALMIILIFFLIIRQASYYIFALVPLALLSIAYYATNATTRNIEKIILLIIIGASSIVFIRRVVLFPFFLQSGISLGQARAIFQDLPIDKERIGVDGTIWPISENYQNMYQWDREWHKPEYLQNNTEGTILMRENYSGFTALPPELSHCRLLKDFFTHKKPIFLGISLANRVPGYAFAVYDCDKTTKND